MKKILILILCMLMIFAMTACGDNGGTEEPVDNPTVEQGDDKDTNTDSSKVTMEQLLKVSKSKGEEFRTGTDETGTEIKVGTYNGTADMIYIPDEINGMPVTIVGKFGFANDTPLKGIRFPDSVREIEDSAAINNANLQVVYLGEGTKSIDEYAFANCTSLYDVRLNDGLEEIGISAFAACENLKAITIPASVVEIDWTAFDKGIVIRGTAGSYAETFASENGHTFEAI